MAERRSRWSGEDDGHRRFGGEDEMDGEDSGGGVDRIGERFSSPYFAAGKGLEKQEAEDEGKDKTESSRQRQRLLAFSNGRLTTRKPFINPTTRTDAARKSLKDIAAETKLLLPGLLATRPDVPAKGYLYKHADAPKLNQRYCPRLPPTQIRVVGSDSLNAALSLISATNRRHPCVLNMANAKSPGGGWEHGALAQEEALCYRTSLSKTLKRHYYPIPELGGIYSPFVLVIRGDLRSGHDLLDLTVPANLPAISVVTAAAVCMPQTTTDLSGSLKYASVYERRLMEEKMRVILRIAAKNRHRQLVLGAFGCGAFANPRQEVAKMWASVLNESEFAGGWWSDVIFAILEDGGGNLRTFQSELDGMVIR